MTPSNTTHPVDALKESLAETWPILAAALVPAVILLVLRIVGVEIRSAAWIAVIACTVLLTVYSFLAGRGWTQPCRQCCRRLHRCAARNHGHRPEGWPALTLPTGGSAGGC